MSAIFCDFVLLGLNHATHQLMSHAEKQEWFDDGSDDPGRLDSRLDIQFYIVSDHLEDMLPMFADIADAFTESYWRAQSD